MGRVCCSLLTFAAMITAGPPSIWETGQLVDASNERVLAGTSQNPYSVFPSAHANYATVRHYLIRSGNREFAIVVLRPVRLSLRPIAPHVVVNTQVRFRLEKKRLVLLDDEGKEFLAEIEREALIDPRTARDKTLEAAKLSADIEKALAAAKLRHPDFGEYEQRMDQISQTQRPAPGMTPDEYIEKLYQLAKSPPQ